MLQELLYDPDAVDFVIRKNQEIENILKDTGKVAIAYTLAGRYTFCYTSGKYFEEIVTLLGESFIATASLVLGLLDRASLETSGILQVHRQPYLDLLGRDVLIGFVDTGIDYTLDVFRYEDGTTKIHYIYDQTIEGVQPEPNWVGTEYTEAQINEALQSPNPREIVPHEDTVGHGTFLASVAAGRAVGDFIGAAPDAGIIAVKLRKARPFYLERYLVPKNQENAFESSAVMLGVEYILTRAQKLGKPVVICIGLGSNFGSHDGYSIFAEYLRGVSTLKGVCLCVAAGNESQARHHTQGIISAKGETQNIDLIVGDREADIVISIWNNVSDRISVSVSSPAGETVGRLPAKAGSTRFTSLVMEPTTIDVSYFFPMEGTGAQMTVVRLIRASPGIWTITLHGDIILDGSFHAWLPMTGFVDPSVEFLSTSPYYTITVPGVMNEAICCGAYDPQQESLYAKTSWGPTRLEMLAPDLVAPGVNIGGYYPSGYGLMDGTSIATAITAGACALMMQWGVVEGNDTAFSTYQIRAYLIRGCSRNEGTRYPNPQWGYGVLNLMQTFQLMREL
ncbi:MAG: S8 family peptidase [Acidithiobacillus sp.]